MVGVDHRERWVDGLLCRLCEPLRTNTGMLQGGAFHYLSKNGYRERRRVPRNGPLVAAWNTCGAFLALCDEPPPSFESLAKSQTQIGRQQYVPRQSVRARCDANLAVSGK